jgi:N-acetyl-anhydromuramyl-L-alanine amidase AmpD
MGRKKIAAILVIASFLFLGGFFLTRNLDFNGKKMIQSKIEPNGENQSKADIGAEKSSDTKQLINDGNEEETIKNNGEAEKTQKSELKDEKTANPVKIINKLVNWGHQKSSGRSIDTIIIHSSYNALGGDQYSVEKLMNEYREYGVSPHYLIDRSGSIYRLVQDKDVAYHAGESQTPDKRTNVNNFSIGVEMMNTKSDKYTQSQYNSLKQLLAYLKEKNTIKYVLGHKDIAKGRKDDPWNFDWDKIK